MSKGDVKQERGKLWFRAISNQKARHLMFFRKTSVCNISFLMWVVRFDMGISLPEAFKLKSGSFMFLRKVLDWGIRSYNPQEFQESWV